MTFETRNQDDHQSVIETETPRRARPLPILVIMHGEASSAGHIGKALEQRGHRLDICKPRFGASLPPTLERHAGVVVFGGPMSCNDPDSYIKDEIDFVGVALHEHKPFLGVCLGAQMLAKHLGAAVSKHPQGKVEIGYGPLRPTLHGRHLGPWPEQVYQWHREGFELPSGGTKLAEGSVFQNQAFCCGTRALGIQFHPEITYAMVNRWTTMAKDWSDSDGAQERSGQLASHLLHAATVNRWLVSLIASWIGGRLPAAA